MALLFGGNTSDEVAVAAVSSINDLNTLTTIQWVYLTGSTNGKRLWQKGPNKALSLSDVPPNLFYVVVRAGANMFVEGVADHISLNEWNCIATTYSEGAGGDIYQGTLTTQITKSSYDNRAAGDSGTTADASSELNICNETAGSPTRAMPGRCGTFQLFNKVLSLGEIQAQQFAPHNTAEQVVYHRYGLNAAGTQPDYSGNGNSGAVTGATVADFVPLRRGFFMPVGWPGNTTVAAGAIPTINLVMAPYIST